MYMTSTPRRSLTKWATCPTSKFKATRPLFPRFPKSMSGFTTSLVEDSHVSLFTRSVRSVDWVTWYPQASRTSIECSWSLPRDMVGQLQGVVFRESLQVWEEVQSSTVWPQQNAGLYLISKIIFNHFMSSSNRKQFFIEMYQTLNWNHLPIVFSTLLD